MKKLVLAFLVFIAVSALGFAQVLVVDYLDGTVELKTSATTWKPVTEGNKLPPESVVRLSAGSVAELTSGTTKVHLSREGTYQLSAVLAQGIKVAPTSLATLTANKVDKLLKAPKARVEIAQMGARGAEKGSSDSLDWAEEVETETATSAPEDPQVTLTAALERQDWAMALTAANHLLANNPEDRPGLLITKARILAAQGRSAGALKAVREAAIPKGQAHFMEAALLVASQGLEAQEYELVLSTTTEALKLNPDTEILQNLTLAQALAWQAKGDAKQAQGLLAAVVKLGAETPMGREAARLNAYF